MGFVLQLVMAVAVTAVPLMTGWALYQDGGRWKHLGLALIALSVLFGVGLVASIPVSGVPLPFLETGP